MICLPAFAAETAQKPVAVESLYGGAEAPPATDAHGHDAAVHHGLPPAAPDAFKIGPLSVSNSMIVTWLVTLAIILFAQ